MKKTAFSTHGSTTSIKTNSHISVFSDSNFSAIILFMVDLAGVEPASEIPFIQRNYNYSLIIAIYDLEVNSFGK